MTDSTKELLGSTINEYLRLFPEEAAAFDTYMKEKRANQRNDFAAQEGSHALERALFEMPDTLHNMVKLRLDEDAYREWRTIKGSLWFIKAYPFFALPSKV